MSKRNREWETDEQRWERKRQKYDKKLEKSRHRPAVIYSNEQEHYGENQVPYFWDETGHDHDERDYSVAESWADDGRESSHMGSPRYTPRVPQPPTPPEPSVPNAVANVEANATATDDVIDPELLLALGSFEEEKTDWGPEVAAQIAMRARPLLLNGMKKDEKEALVKRYPFPNNLQLSKAPLLNPEISAMLTEQSRNRDKRVMTKQNQIGSALSAVTKAITLLLSNNNKVEVLTILSDATRLLADSHFLETETRRSLVSPLMEKAMIEVFKDRCRDDFLFGANLGEIVKSSQGIKRTGQLLQAPRLNSKGPAPHGQHRLKGYAHRVSGQNQRRNYQPRRQQPPAPPTGRRQYNAPRRQQVAAAPARTAPASNPAPATRT